MQSGTTPLTASARAAPILFTATIFLSAALLFFVQPLYAKIALPLIGGTSAVWTVAMLFFQTVLILGYLYALLSTRYLRPRAQLLVHLALWLAAAVTLPLAAPDGWTYDATGSASLQTLGLFALGVGLPFAALAGNAPLLQSWYARSGGPHAQDPYFLYGASNLGSLAALLAFPLVAEPLIGARAAALLWMGGFILLGAGLLTAGVLARTPTVVAPTNVTAPLPQVRENARIWLWMLVAFLPSSAMLAVTTKISTDITALPLLWVVPLSLYLLSFVLTFTRRRIFSERMLFWAGVGGTAILGFGFSGLSGAYPTWAGAGTLTLALFLLALYAHSRLYALRPNGRDLTLFYLFMSLGGAAGGVFNSLIAPWAFTGLWEGTITAILAAVLLIADRFRLRAADLRPALAAGLGGAGVLLLVARFAPASDGLATDAGTLLLMAAALILFRTRPATGALAAILVLAGGLATRPGEAVHRERSFFGLHQVHDNGPLRQYANGTTVHGAQRLADLAAGARPEPQLYYHRDGPLGQVMAAAEGARSIGIVGLGVGALACYARPGQDWHFYEIDRVVDRIARDPAMFTFLSACTPGAPTHLGDARVVLAAQTDRRFDILIIDAYSSDSVPVHLTTVEAMALYLDRLAPGGLLMFHISNRYFDIDRPLARAALALGLDAAIRRYPGNPEVDPGNTASVAVAIARKGELPASVSVEEGWQTLVSDGGLAWTDDFANVLGILRR